ncbi:hypothetical protein V2J09_001307, partial [Rumex salicifolius]
KEIGKLAWLLQFYDQINTFFHSIRLRCIVLSSLLISPLYASGTLTTSFPLSPLPPLPKPTALPPVPSIHSPLSGANSILLESTEWYIWFGFPLEKMFGGSNSAFGQSSGSPFGSQSGFGQMNNTSSNNPFAPKPFGSPNPFGSQTGSPMFGSTSTGVFGAAQSPSPLSSAPAFGASSTPAFGASTTPTFGSASPSFGGSSVFGQKPAFGGFGSSTPTPSSPFGSSFQQSQPAFGSNLFGSSSTPAFGSSTTPAFGSSSTPTFGSTPAFGASTPGFGANSSPAFGANTTPAFGASSTPAFGSTNTTTFGNTGTGFGASASPFGSGGGFGASSTSTFGSSTTPAFGASSAPAFGATSSPSFGTSPVPAFGASSTPAFGVASTPAFGSSTTPSFSFGSSPSFGQTQTTSAFGTASSPFGTTTSPFGAQSSAFGSQTTTPTFGTSGFGQSPFGAQRGGSRVAPYTPTPEADVAGQTPGKLESISAMPVYKDKSHEELRWEDYQQGDKGGPNPAGQSTSTIGFGSPSAAPNPFASSSTFNQTSPNPFSTPSTSSPFGAKPSPFGSTGFGTTTSGFNSSGFGTTNTSNPFGTPSAATSSPFPAPSSTPFGSNTSLFGTTGSSAFGSSPSLFGSASAQGTTPSFASGLNFLNSSSAQPFQSTTPSIGQTGGAFGQTGLPFGQTSTASFGQSSLFNTPSSFGGGNLFSSSTSLFGQTTPSLSIPFSAAPSTQTNSAFGFGNLNQTQTGMGAFGGGSGMFGQNVGQLSATQSPAVMQPATVTNPFGLLPAMPQISIGHNGTSPSIQYGISSMPVIDKPPHVRISSLLTSRHLSQRRTKLPARKYHPKNDGQKVAFFSDEEKTPSTPKADAVFIPRENPRSLIIRPMDHWPTKAHMDKSPPLKDTTEVPQENGRAFTKENEHSPNGFYAADKGKAIAEDESGKEENCSKTKANQSQYSNGVRIHDDHQTQKGDSYITLGGHRAGEAAIVYEHGADIEAMMPKLRHSDYYTEPRIQELAAKERAEPGFCRHVNNFVVGRHGYGSIKFLGETDVRRLDLESLIQFNNREVIVYMDDSKKPPVGQGLNKPAEVTLLNIKCFNKKTGEQITSGPRIDKYKEMLRKKAEDQGAEFVSYDPVKGEWKFKVSHFSSYKLDGENDEDDLEKKDEQIAIALC